MDDDDNILTALLSAVADASVEGRPKAIRINPTALAQLMDQAKGASVLLGFLPHSFQGIEVIQTPDVATFEIVR